MVLSDGVSSPFDLETSGSVLQTARRAGVAVYPVLVTTPMPAKAPNPPPPPLRRRVTSKRKGEQQTMENGVSVAGFRRLAESGGQLPTVLPTGNSLPGLFAEIAKTLRYSYVASYRPSKGTREVKVELVEKKRGKVIGGVRTVVR